MNDFEISVSLPAPLSVNQTRKVDWRQHKRVKRWWDEADALFLTQKRALLGKSITGRYELLIVLQDGLRLDADNGLKLLIDGLRRFGVVTDDGPKYLRRIIVEFGDVKGCRITIKSLGMFE